MEKLMTPEEIAELVQAKKDTIYDWVHRKEIPYVKVGRLVRFVPAQIDAWLLNNQRGKF